MIIAVDFDGTIVEHRYPKIGKEKPFAIETLKKLSAEGHRLILWTVREGKKLDEAIAFCRERGLEFYAANRNYPEESMYTSRKLDVDVWIDDHNLGELPDWGVIYEMITQQSQKEKKSGFLHKLLGKKMFLAIFILLVLSTTSCTPYQKIPYLQNIGAVNGLSQAATLYDARILPKDLLTITVNTTDPEVAAPFNLTVPTIQNAQNTNTISQQQSLQQYLVDNEGNIDFPVVGQLHVGGLTKNEAEELIKEKLKSYLKETPIVTVRMANYKIAVLGEVAKPGTFTIGNEKVNVLEALAMAGDMTIWGVRDSVKLVRENAEGYREIVLLDLNQADLVNNPYYQLQQNDILYVTPNRAKAKNSDIGQSTSLWVSGTSILVSLASLLVNILK